MNRWFGVVSVIVHEQNCNRHAARLLIWTTVTIFSPSVDGLERRTFVISK